MPEQLQAGLSELGGMEGNKNKPCKNRDWHSLWPKFLLCRLRCAVRTSDLLKASPVGCSSLQTVDLSFKRGGEYILGSCADGKGGVKTHILSKEADIFLSSWHMLVLAVLGC